MKVKGTNCLTGCAASAQSILRSKVFWYDGMNVFLLSLIVSFYSSVIVFMLLKGILNIWVQSMIDFDANSWIIESKLKILTALKKSNLKLRPLLGSMLRSIFQPFSIHSSLIHVLTTNVKCFSKRASHSNDYKMHGSNKVETVKW